MKARFSYLISGFLLGLFLFQCKPSTPAINDNVSTASSKPITEQAIPSIVETSEIERIVSFLAHDERQGRDVGSTGLEAATVFAENFMQENNVLPFFETFRDTFKVGDKNTSNVVGYLPGVDSSLVKEFVIIGAHFDHIGAASPVNGDNIANGANDNAAGSAAVLSLAKYFAKKKTNKRSLLFVLFSAEEKGLKGSAHLAALLKARDLKLYTMVNFEMIGVPLNHHDYSAYITGFKSSNMAAKFNEYVGSSFLGFLPKAKEYNLFKRSDNYPFYQEFNVPCQTISTFDFTNYDYYHHVDDEATELDYNFMATLIDGCGVAIDKITNAPTNEIKLN